nr:D-amino acid dehydrogenase [uncultured Roseateles sp.]
MSGRREKHCVVIGAGVVGLTSAWALAERGFAVTLIEREAQVGQGASFANGGQLSYRYVSPLADAGVPLKALRWLLDPDGPLRFKPDLRSLQQWRWMAQFLRACRAPVNQQMTTRLLALGAYSQAAFAQLHADAKLSAPALQLRSPGKLVLYRHAAEFKRVRQRLQAQPAGAEQALDAAACLQLEPALAASSVQLAGGIFTPGEAVADCHAFCTHLAASLQRHPNFRGLVRGEVLGFTQGTGGRIAAVQMRQGDLAADDFVLAAGLQSRSLAQSLGLRLPLYPLKGYSLTAPIAAEHLAPEISVTDFEKKVVYARIGAQMRVAAMVDMVGDDASLDPRRLASLRGHVQAMFPRSADYSQASAWAGLRPATPSGAPILGETPLRNLWLNVGHGALGFTFSFGTANIVADLVAGRASPVPLDGFQLA